MQRSQAVVLCITAVFLVSSLEGCSSTPTVEQANTQNAKIEADCQAKGYNPGTRDFDTCMALALQGQGQDALNKQFATGMAIWVASTALT